jgi:hypothetical protein
MQGPSGANVSNDLPSQPAARRPCPYRRGVAGPPRADGGTTCTTRARRHSVSAASSAVLASRQLVPPLWRYIRSTGGDADARSCLANVVERGFQAGESTWANYCCARLCWPERLPLGLWCCWPVPRQPEAQPLYAAVGVANGHAGSELIVAGPRHSNPEGCYRSGGARGDAVIAPARASRLADNLAPVAAPQRPGARHNGAVAGSIIQTMTRPIISKPMWKITIVSRHASTRVSHCSGARKF